MTPGNQLAALADIAAFATSLDERIGLSLRRARPEVDTGDARHSLVEAWIKNAARGSDDLFSRRLAWDGLERDQLADVLRPPAPCPEHLPPWLTLLQDAYRWGQQGASPTDPDVARVLDPERPLPFEEILLPLVAHGRREIHRRAGGGYAGLAAGAQVVLERALLQQLTRICAQALHAAFSVLQSPSQARLAAILDSADEGNARTAYTEFVRRMLGGRLLGFFREHSVAARLCATSTQNWIAFVIEFLGRVDDDRPTLAQLFGDGGALGPIVSLETALSDAHDGGRGVLIAQFAGGVRVVYKPRPLALEAFFAEIVRWSNATGEVLALRATTVLARPNYGWVQFIEHQPCANAAEVRRFYRRCGILLAILYGIRGSDFHLENLIASGEHPYLIDAEALLSHGFALGAASAGTGGETGPLLPDSEDSVLRVHLLPFLKFSPDGQTMEAGGLQAAPPKDYAVETLAWRNINTDSMRLVRAQVRAPAKSRNLPRLADQPVAAFAYVDEIVTGFRQMYGLLLRRRAELLAPDGLLSLLGPHPVRFVFRHTTLYAALLERTLHPRYLRDGAQRSLELDVLAQPLLQLAERPPLWPMLREERRALEDMDIPLFATRADACDLPLPTGEVVEGCFGSSAVEEARRKLLALGEGDCRLQEELIRAAFASVLAHGLGRGGAVHAGPAAEKEPLTDRARREAERLAGELALRARLAGDTALWVGPSFVASAGRHTAGTLRPTLIDGSAGIALALAAAAAVTGRDDFAALARAGLRPLLGPLGDLAARLERGTVDPGAGVGVASGACALMHAAHVLADPSLLAAARASAAVLDPARLSPRAPDDLVAGRAGALLLLVKLHEATHDSDLLAAAHRFADALLSRRVRDRQTGCQVWTGRSRRGEAGLAHGQSGIAYALGELAALSDRAELRDAAREALRHERQIVGTDLLGTESSDAGAAWSHGAAGIGLARVALLRRFDDEELRSDLEAAVERTRRHLDEGVDDLCGGVLGRIELLLAAAGPLSRPELQGEAWAAADRLLARAAAAQGRYRLGWGAGYEPPGLFEGTAALVYGCARIANPGLVPSVALLA